MMRWATVESEYVGVVNSETPSTLEPELERRGVDVIRALALDATNEARSGHQGTAMALAPLAHVLYTRVLRYDATDPGWPDRDRFVLSAGHASMLLYSLLYLTGQGLELKDLREFRQWGSATPGHPEAGTHPRRRGHHRAARSGLRQLVGDGDRRAPAAQPVRDGALRPPHLRDRGRRRPLGGGQPRGCVARRSPRARPARRRLRRQPGHDRRADGPRPLGRRSDEVRRLRLARERPRGPR